MLFMATKALYLNRVERQATGASLSSSTRRAPDLETLKAPGRLEDGAEGFGISGLDATLP